MDKQILKFDFLLMQMAENGQTNFEIRFSFNANGRKSKRNFEIRISFSYKLQKIEVIIFSCKSRKSNFKHSDKNPVLYRKIFKLKQCVLNVFRY